MSLSRCAFFSLVALLGMSAIPAAAQPKGPPPTVSKSGWIDDPKLMRFAPPTKVVVSEKAFKDLWKAWKLEGEAPKVDFTRELVIVATGKGQGVFFATVLNGNLMIELNGPPPKDKAGFAYQIQTHTKEGVNKADNKPLPQQ